MSLLFNLEAVLEDFSDEMKQTIRYIYALVLLPKPKVAFHASDADGIVSAVILKHITPFRKMVFIPLGYQELRHPEFGSFLSSVDWRAITDLSPFHGKRASLYCDHHVSSSKIPKNADLVIFQAGAPSASILLGEHFKSQIQPEIFHLAELTVITDTAGYTTPPPIKSPVDPVNASKEEQAWLLDDLCRTVETIEEILTLVQDLSSQQLSIITQPIYQERLQALYNLRVKSFELAKEITPADVVIVIQGKKKVLTSSLVYGLFQRQVKITCILYPGKRFTGLSFRINSIISDEILDDYRVDHLSNQFSGGGHPRAAGGRADSLPDALKKLEEWIKARNLTMNIHDLRAEHKPNAKKSRY
ncbi:MAG: DHH family phosphoesterase [Candidatus Heimdallarchaeota archaeon]|nr:DHH family phosphoesterase [Candidatus Heimdallarchaeota archaeon]